MVQHYVDELPILLELKAMTPARERHLLYLIFSSSANCLLILGCCSLYIVQCQHSVFHHSKVWLCLLLGGTFSWHVGRIFAICLSLHS